MLKIENKLLFIRLIYNKKNILYYILYDFI
jgi:hypothetical protein